MALLGSWWGCGGSFGLGVGGEDGSGGVGGSRLGAGVGRCGGDGGK